jgi:hypothetical protein
MIINADILKWAEEYDGPKFHALLCDPPYHLTNRVVDWAGFKDPHQGGRGEPRLTRANERGFMNAKWDGGDVAFRPETWATLAQHLHPGAFGMAFASTKGYHRMACAIEDAGLIIHPMVVYAFGSGFPKATRIDVQVDRRAGAERKVIGQRKHQPKFAAAELGYREKDNGYNGRDRESFDVTAPATELAAAWEGHRYGGQVLKPALEPICVFQKPYQGRPVDCITRTGAGALWVDGGRIDTGERWARNNKPGQNGAFNASGGSVESGNGRWPANLILDHCAAQALDVQSGTLTSGSKHGFYRRDSQGIYGDYPPQEQHVDGDSGGASRYFHQADWAYEIEERMAVADPVRYCAKASRAEREAGLDPMQIKLLGLMEAFEQTTVDDGRQTPIDNAYLRGETKRRNTHPTIKPISLARYLATLLLPPDLYAPRRILVPFAGAGSEVIGTMLAGWEEVVGVELEEQHVRITEARLAFWQTLRYRLLDPAADLSVDLDDDDSGQLPLF